MGAGGLEHPYAHTSREPLQHFLAMGVVEEEEKEEDEEEREEEGRRRNKSISSGLLIFHYQNICSLHLQ
jgi:hypothetical protein